MQRGCLFCKSNRAEKLALTLNTIFSDVRAIAPARMRYRRVNGVAMEERVPLLPGYVFFEAEDGVPVHELLKASDALRLLTYGNGDWRLRGYDDQFAEKLFSTNGEIGFSRAYYDEGDRIRIVDGFLKEYEGSIIRVNRRAKTAEVSMELQDKRVSMWLGFELIKRAD